MAAELLGQPSGIFALAGCIAAQHTKDRSQSLSIGRRETSHTTLLASRLHRDLSGFGYLNVLLPAGCRSSICGYPGPASQQA